MGEGGGSIAPPLRIGDAARRFNYSSCKRQWTLKSWEGGLSPALRVPQFTKEPAFVNLTASRRVAHFPSGIEGGGEESGGFFSPFLLFLLSGGPPRFFPGGGKGGVPPRGGKNPGRKGGPTPRPHPH